MRYVDRAGPRIRRVHGDHDGHGGHVGQVVDHAAANAGTGVASLDAAWNDKYSI